MNFQRGQDPKRAMGLGAIKMFWVSGGAGAAIADEKIEYMLEHWIKTKQYPNGVWPLVLMNNKNCFVETRALCGKLIEWRGKYYDIPENKRK